MNKTVKGSLAGAAGVALLMGGFGSYALWSDSQPLAANGVSTGQLNIATTAGSYDDANTPAASDWTTSDKMVPGDVVTYTQTFTAKGDGKNLKGTIALASPGALQGTSSTITRSVAITSNNATVSQVTPTSFAFTAPFGTATLTAVVTYTLPSTTSNLVDQNVSASTPATAFTISQS